MRLSDDTIAGRKKYIVLAVITILAFLSLAALFDDQLMTILWPAPRSIFARQPPPASFDECKTMLYVFTGHSGFTSSINIALRAQLYARYHGYHMIYASHPSWVYGRIEDYFRIEPPACQLPADPYNWNTRYRKRLGQAGFEGSQHIYAMRSDWKFLDSWILQQSFNGTHSATSQSSLQNQMHEAALQLWKPVDDCITQREEMQKALFDPSDLVIAVHYRGGDKLKFEVFDEHSGEARPYLNAALSVRNSLCRSCKPTLAIMTVEAGVEELFKQDPLSSDFNIVSLPAPGSGLQGHVQTEFNGLPLKQRTAMTRILIRDLDWLAFQADAAIVTASSNIGSLAKTLGGPNSRIISIDAPFTVTTEWKSQLQHQA